MKKRWGVVIALATEAHQLFGQWGWQLKDGKIFRRVSVTPGLEFYIVQSGIGYQRAYSAACWLMAQKVDGLLVLGVSGGLDPALEPGTLVVADRVLHYYNDRVSRIWQGSSSVCRQAQNNLKARQLTTRIGDILTMPQSVLSVRNKQLLFHQLGALTVDTESAAAAFAADQNHLPFFTMRVVCDPARQAMSPEINSIVNIDGKIKPLYLVNCLFRNPLLITELFCLAKQYPKAMSSLRRGFHILANSGIFLF